MDKIEAIEMYTTEAGIKHYTDAVTEIGLWESEKKIIQKYIKSNDKILDLGCGAGRTTFGLYDLGYINIIGLDLAKPLIDFAKKYSTNNEYSIQFIHGDSTDLPFEDNSFECVFYSFNGLQLIPEYQNRLKALQEIYRVLKKDGIFIFTAHDRNSTLEYQEFWTAEYEKWKENPNNLEFGDVIPEEYNGKGFIHYSSIDEMIQFIKTTSFQIIECTSRNKLAKESKKIEDFSSETNFWILKK